MSRTFAANYHGGQPGIFKYESYEKVSEFKKISIDKLCQIYVNSCKRLKTEVWKNGYQESCPLENYPPENCPPENSPYEITPLWIFPPIKAPPCENYPPEFFPKKTVHCENPPPTPPVPLEKLPRMKSPPHL